MKAFSNPSTKTFKLLALLAANAALLGCVGARNSATHQAPSSAVANAPMLAAQVPLEAPFEAQAMAFLSPSIAQDAHGNRIAVWEAFDGQTYKIWAKRSVAGLGWGASQRLDAPREGNAYRPRIAFDPQGHAMAVWEQYLDGHYKVWANRYTAAQGWGVALPIDRMPSITPSDAYAPQVALNAAGEAVAVWQQSDGYHSHVRASRYIPGSGWINAASLGSATGHASDPQIAFNTQGVALAVWHQFDGLKTQVWASQQPASGSWGLPTLLEPQLQAQDTGSIAP